MKHLFSYSVYQDLNDIGKDLQATFSRIKCDGLETLTSHEAMDPVYHRHTVSVHLPFATDWLAAWEGRAYEMSEYYSKYYMYGRDRDEVIATIRNMIEIAAPAHPEHGVIHASNVDLTELRKRRYSLDSNRVLRTFCEMMNASVADFPGGEPPFKDSGSIMAKKTKRSGRLRIDIIVVVSIVILLVTFFSYMLNTSLEDVLAEQRGEGVIITHTDSKSE